MDAHPRSPVLVPETTIFIVLEPPPLPLRIPGASPARPLLSLPIPDVAPAPWCRIRQEVGLWWLNPAERRAEVPGFHPKCDAPQPFRSQVRRRCVLRSDQAPRIDAVPKADGRSYRGQWAAAPSWRPCFGSGTRGLARQEEMHLQLEEASAGPRLDLAERSGSRFRCRREHG